MTKRRINPDTGVFEHEDDDLPFGITKKWYEDKNEDGERERINPETGVHEVTTDDLPFGITKKWVPKEED